MKILLVFFLFPALVLAQSFNIKDYGAKPDGQTINTNFIQKAIDECNAKGGGTVVIPAGTYLSGTVFLKSHVNLHIEHGGVLKGSSNMADYQANNTKYGLVYASDCEDISLTGEGEINGNGTHFMDLNRRHNFIDYDKKFIRQGEKFMEGETGIGDGPVAFAARPGMMIAIFHSEKVSIKNLRLVDTSEWTIRISECENVEVSHLTILANLLIPNSDGIHCTTSRNVIIDNCNIHTGDDSIIVSGLGDESGVGGYTEKANATGFRFGNKTKIAENVVVSNCILQSRSAGIRIGYGLNDIKNLIFSNLLIYDSNRGIGVFCRDNNLIENIVFSNIQIQCRLHSGKWWGKGEPIHVSAIKQSGTEKLGKIRGLHFSNIRINRAEAGIVVYGDSESSIEDIDFENIDLKIENGPLSNNYGGNFDMRPSAQPNTALFKHDIPAFYAGYVKNINLTRFRLIWKDSQPAEYFTNGFFAENFENLQLEKIEAEGARKGTAAVVLQSGKGLITDNSKSLIGVKIK